MVSYSEESDGRLNSNNISKSIANSKDTISVAPGKVNGKRKLGAVDVDDENHAQDTNQSRKRSAGANAKAKAEDKTMPFANRTTLDSLKKAMYIGAHVSAAGGVFKATCLPLCQCSDNIYTYSYVSTFFLTLTTDFVHFD